jgi:hypothetical protein
MSVFSSMSSKVHPLPIYLNAPKIIGSRGNDALPVASGQVLVVCHTPQNPRDYLSKAGGKCGNRTHPRKVN